jgi:predicted ABC-type ATPase/predicted transcriptional regulator of viral defense system
MFAQAHGERRPTPALVKRLKYLQSTRRVVSLERGLYATVRPGSSPDAVSPDPYLAAAALRPDGVFAYHSALTLLGAGHSDWNVVTLLSHRRRRRLVLRTARVEVLLHPAVLVRKSATDLGVRHVPYLETTLRVTGPERTLVDGFRQLRLVGGLEELVTSAAGFASLDLEKLDAVLRAYDLRILYAAVGWFLETYRAHFLVRDDFLTHLEHQRPAAPHYLPRRTRSAKDGGRLVPRWSLILPEAALRGAEPYEPPLEQLGKDVERVFDGALSPPFALADASRRSSARAPRPSVSEPGVTRGKAPQVVVIGGPNGAGKTSSAPDLLRDTVGIDAFVNADVIAEGLSGFRPQESAVEAGRILLARLRELAERQVDFAFEGTLSGRTLHAFLRRLADIGYESHVFYLWLPSVELAVARVRRRVQAGGHDVPEPVIRRRFRASLVNFDRFYRPAASAWRLYDGSFIGGRRLIAHGATGSQPAIVDAERWAFVRRQIEGENL